MSEVSRKQVITTEARKEAIRKELQALGNKRFTFADCPEIAREYIHLIRVIRVLPEDAQNRIMNDREDHFARLIKCHESLEDKVSAVVHYLEMLEGHNHLMRVGFNADFVSRLPSSSTISTNPHVPTFTSVREAATRKRSE